MKKINLILLFLWLMALPIANAQMIDSEKSMASFKIGNMKLNTVKGTFQGMKGAVAFDANNLDQSNFKVCIDAATVNTGSKKRDAHLLEDDFFAVTQHPTICFESTAFEKTGDGYLTNGNLSIRGINKPVSIPFTYDGKTFTGTLTVNRFDFNIGADTGTFLIGEEVEIEIVCVLQK